MNPIAVPVRNKAAMWVMTVDEDSLANAQPPRAVVGEPREIVSVRCGCYSPQLFFNRRTGVD